MVQPKETHWNSSNCFYLVKITDKLFNFACEIFKVVFSKGCVTYLSEPSHVTDVYQQAPCMAVSV